MNGRLVQGGEVLAASRSVGVTPATTGGCVGVCICSRVQDSWWAGCVSCKGTGCALW